MAAKVASGDLDAGIVYVTDVLANDDEVDGVEIPANNVDAIPIATVAEAPRCGRRGAPSSSTCSDDDGQQVLAGFGFLPPS